MAEIAGLASVITLIEFSGKILSLGYGYLEKVVKAPYEFRMLLIEVGNISAVLDRLHSHLVDVEQAASLVLQKLRIANILPQCAELLEEIKKSLQNCEFMGRNGVNRLFSRLLWPIAETTVKGMIDRLGRFQRIMSDAIAVDTAAAISRLERKSFERHLELVHHAENIGARLEAVDLERLRAWICPLNVSTNDNYEAALEHRAPGTGTWFLTSPEYIYWRVDDRNGWFWLLGPPGSGKTVLSAIAIEELDLISGSGIGSVYYFFDYRNSNKTALMSFFDSVVGQLLQQAPAGMDDVQSLRLSRKMGHPTADEYLSLTRALINRFDRVYLVIDAVDECIELKGLIDALRSLMSLESNSCLRVLSTSRYTVSLETALSGVYTSSVSIVKENDIKNAQDIRSFVEHEVSKMTATSKISAELRERILDLVPLKAKGL
jgi:NACHT domain